MVDKVATNIKDDSMAGFGGAGLGGKRPGRGVAGSRALGTVGESRADAQARSLRYNTATYLSEPSDRAVYADFLREFNLDARVNEVTTLLSTDTELRRIHSQLVPRKVPYNTFWARYFFALHQLEAQAGKRRALLERVEAEAAEDGAWDDDGWGDSGWADEVTPSIPKDSNIKAKPAAAKADDSWNDGWEEAESSAASAESAAPSNQHKPKRPTKKADATARKTAVAPTTIVAKNCDSSPNEVSAADSEVASSTVAKEAGIDQEKKKEVLNNGKITSKNVGSATQDDDDPDQMAPIEIDDIARVETEEGEASSDDEVTFRETTTSPPVTVAAGVEAQAIVQENEKAECHKASSEKEEIGAASALCDTVTLPGDNKSASDGRPAQNTVTQLTDSEGVNNDRPASGHSIESPVAPAETAGGDGDDRNDDWGDWD